MAGAIPHERESCQFLFYLRKLRRLYRSARSESALRNLSRPSPPPLGRIQSERRRRACVGKRFSAPQIVWNRSTRWAGARGGARVGRRRWLRILSITGGSLGGGGVF